MIRPKTNQAQALPKSILNRIWEFFGLPLLLGLTIAIGLLIFFSWLAGEVLKGDTQKFDETIRLFVHNLASPVVTDFMRFFTFLGSTLFLTSLGICATAGFIYFRWKRAALLFVVTIAGAIVLNDTLKTAFQRARPEPYFDTPLPSSFSFPSGHALFSFCFYGVLLWLIVVRIKNRVTRLCLWAATGLLIFLIGLSRIYLGVHYPSDVLAGYAAAFVWVFAITLADFLYQRRTNASRKVELAAANNAE